jgi:hypothetical protein
LQFWGKAAIDHINHRRAANAEDPNYSCAFLHRPITFNCMQYDRIAPSRSFCRSTIIGQQGNPFGRGRTFNMGQDLRLSS